MCLFTYTVMGCICCKVHEYNTDDTDQGYNEQNRGCSTKNETEIPYKKTIYEYTDYRNGLAITHGIESSTTICEEGQEMASTSQTRRIDEERPEKAIQTCTSSENRRQDTILEGCIGCIQTEGTSHPHNYQVSYYSLSNIYTVARTGENNAKSLCERKDIQTDREHVFRTTNYRERRITLRCIMPTIEEEN